MDYDCVDTYGAEHKATKYRVWLTLPGSVARPGYDGYVDVFARDPIAAQDRAIRQCMRTAFPDVWYSSFRVERVELR